MPNCSKFSSRRPISNADCGLRIAGPKNTRAVIVCMRDDYARRYGACRAFHGSPNFLGRMKCHSADCRSAAAEEGAKRASLLRSADHAREKRNQFLPVRLMQVIRESAAQITIIA